MTIRSHCQVLLSAEDFWRYQELIDKEYFEYDCEENRLDEWRDLCAKFDPDDEDIGSSDHEGQMNLRDDFENNLIAYHQLKAFSLYLEDKPTEFAAYREFLVSIFYFGACMYYVCNDVNLTPSFCRFTTVVRLLPTGRLGSQ